MDGWNVLLVLGTISVTSSVTQAFNLTLLHTNDVHARIQEVNKYNGRCSDSDAQKGKCFGGMARLKTKIDEMRSQFPNSLLLDSGDQYQGTLFFYIHGGQMSAHFMNLLGYDAMVVGNHEFDGGTEGLKPFLDNVTFPVLSSNVDTSKTPEVASILKYKVLQVSGEKIGVVGYTTTSTPIISNPGEVAFNDEITSVQTVVDALIGQGVNKIIALGHAGFNKDKEIAQKVRGVDVVIGGHSNTFLYNGDAPANESPVGAYPTVIENVDGNDVLVVQDYAYGKYLGFLQVDFDDQGKVTSWNGNPILLDKSVAKDSEVYKVIQAYLPDVEAKMNERISQSLVMLQGDRFSCRVYECNMGNLITDAMVRQNMRYADSTQWNHVSIAITNSGGIRSSLEKGIITASDALSVMPFRNTVDIVEITGELIVEILEQSVAKWVKNSSDLSGAFLQVSGMRVVYDPRREVGNRVVEVKVTCTDCLIPDYIPLSKTKIYKVLIPSYLVGGGDGFKMIKGNIKGEHTIGDLDSQLLIDYLTENSPIATGLEGRIQFLEDIEAARRCKSDSPVFLASIVVPVLSVITILYNSL